MMLHCLSKSMTVMKILYHLLCKSILKMKKKEKMQQKIKKKEKMQQKIKKKEKMQQKIKKKSSNNKD